MTIVAAVQMTSGSDVAANLAEAGRLIEGVAAAGAGLVLLPENFNFLGQRDSDKREIAAGRADVGAATWASLAGQRQEDEVVRRRAP